MLASVISASPRGRRRRKAFEISCIHSKARYESFLENNRQTVDYSFPHYLLSKQTVDDRALNKDVLNALRAQMPLQAVSIIEVGAGIGTMLKRLAEWNIFCVGEYTLVDAMEENLDYAREWIPQWAAQAGLSLERLEHNHLHLCNKTHDIRIHFECADVFDFIQKNKVPADV